ncbi:MAG TPA: serine esterase [Candidatus Paceibacterota bacterium]|nr:serine esterase [Verrucomicrobiota bacterium]HOX01663.1 serine esterase [Verrucomicrobiota bacterium]HRZ43903.1 serine esterase [Candidatus Paceibacterota bacterium]HRZ91643.1 serine esterase [Candidatus Paceibacterota bacterium]
MLRTELIPARTAGSRRLMVVLHGLGDSREGYRWLPSALQLPWMNYLLVDAPDPYHGGYSWFDFEGDALGGVGRSRRLLTERLDELTGQGWPADQISLLGFSQGCLMILETGLRYPHRLAALVGISGFLLHPEGLIRELSPAAARQTILITHGLYDPLLSIDLVRPQIRQLQSAGLNIQWHELAKEHTIAGQQEIGIIRDFIEACYPE